jgi:hypothetical protein
MPEKTMTTGTQESKRCSGPCGQIKAATEFGTRRLASGRGLVSKCKLCQRASRKVAAAIANLERLQLLGSIYEPFDRLNEATEGCLRWFGGDSHDPSDGVRVCGRMPAKAVELSAPKGVTRLRLCPECELESAVLWTLKPLEGMTAQGVNIG